MVGGGQLVVGGGDALNGASSSAECRANEDTMVGNAMVQAAAKGIAPFELQQYELVKVTRANRPLPSDGFPVVGFVDEALYVAVMHSAVTMGPLIGELAAYEIVSGEGFQILDRYRPSQSRAECGMFAYSILYTQLMLPSFRGLVAPFVSFIDSTHPLPPP